ncbi:hypothetical protein EVAR_56044_1 [Eumeta japonica]|uniref:Uncharacterized protein n=1 Tax=Eumeta variegata TaxID=151549 RepID=A0A4C1YBI6_EUMVA|nr:hypothetical protein EVAR_56044_1 [Eumeta japonica]
MVVIKKGKLIIIKPVRRSYHNITDSFLRKEMRARRRRSFNLRVLGRRVAYGYKMKAHAEAALAIDRVLIHCDRGDTISLLN